MGLPEWHKKITMLTAGNKREIYCFLLIEQKTFSNEETQTRLVDPFAAAGRDVSSAWCNWCLVKENHTGCVLTPRVKNKLLTVLFSIWFSARFRKGIFIAPWCSQEGLPVHKVSGLIFGSGMPEAA